MGLSLYYNGRFGNPELLQQMIDEVEDIANTYKWKYSIEHTIFPGGSFGNKAHDKKIYGISFTPPDCETVSICFLSNGRMSCSSLLQFYGDSTDKKSRQYLYMLSVKTQFAGWQTHLFIVQLLRYLSKKYFSEFNVSDEGHYWETNDEEILKQNFNRYAALLNSVSTAFETFPVNEGETMDKYIERMMNFVSKKLSDE
jgi:hypothetical protein